MAEPGIETVVDSNVEEEKADQTVVENAPVESLIAGRRKRSTAGNRLAALLNQAEEDDIDLLFEEKDDDEEFYGKDESDVELGSSSDEEDKQGQDDELTGEKELEQEAKAQRAKGKKFKESFPGQAQLEKLLNKPNSRAKRVVIQEPSADHTDGDTTNFSANEDESTNNILDDNFRKKSERISWIPKQDDKPSRQSSRRQTVANKQYIHQRLKEAEERRVKTITAMSEAQLRKKKTAKVWTQEMRLEQAKKNEIMNLKSLNKWQEAEAERMAARQAKLAAMHAQKLEGPLITIYSACATYDQNAKMIRVGKRDYIEELPELYQEKQKAKRGPKGPRSHKDGDMKSQGTQPETLMKGITAANTPDTLTNTPKNTMDVDSPQIEGESTRDASPENRPPHTEQPQIQDPSDTPSQNDVVGPHQQLLPDTATKSESREVSMANDGERDDNSRTVASPKIDTQAETRDTANDNFHDDGDKPDPQTPLISQEDLFQAARTFVILENFDSDAIRNREYQSKILFPQNRGHPPRPDKPLCVVTNQIAKFRDPGTGLPYANLSAYRQIQRVRGGEILWSDTYQCFIAPKAEAAAGVPDGFL